MTILNSKRIKAAIILVCTLTILASCGKVKKDAKFTTAIVNGKAITRITFDKEMARIKENFQSKNSGDTKDLDGIQGEVLEILIGGELLYQASVGKGIAVSEKEISADLEKVKIKFPENGAAINTFTKEDIKRKMAIEKFITSEFSDPTIISDAESKKYYNDNLDDFTKPEQVMASHILISITPDANPDEQQTARSTIEGIKKQITSNTDFAELAKKYSQDSTAKNGGALGYVMRGQMVEPFEKAAFSLKKGEVSDIVQTKYGFHLIKVLDKKPMVVIAYQDIADKLKAYLKQQKVQRKVDSFIKKERTNAKVEIFLPNSA